MEEKRLIKRKKRSEESGNLEQLAHYSRELGEYYRKIGKHNEALKQYKEEEKINVALNRPIAVAVSNRMIGEIYCDIGNSKEALKYQEKHLAISRKEKSGIEEQRALANLGRTYFCMAEVITKSELTEYNLCLSSAKKAYIQSLAVCENIKGIGQLAQMEMRARLMLNIGLVVECQGKVDKAIEYIEKAIQIAKQYELWEELFRCYSALGLLHQRSGDCTRALHFLSLAVEVAGRLDARERHLCEALFSKAEVLFIMADFGGAKQALLKAYKLKTPDENERTCIEKNLRIAAKLCQAEKMVLSTDGSDHKALKSLYETLGDGAVAVQNFKKAIEYYLKMLECAMEVGESGRDLCPIYVSLAQTYKDNNQYDLALEYSRKELDICKDNPQEACKSMLAIAELLELSKAPYIEVSGTYIKAKELAAEAQDWKLMLTTMQCLQAYQKNSGFEDIAENTRKECEDIIASHDIPESSDDGGLSGEETVAVGDSVDLDQLTESESDEGENHGGECDQANRRSKRRKVAHKGLSVQRNEKGETALHKACISGNISLVQRLIERAHPVNVRDHCGWTPLHEACNHGHEEIVSLLIEKGALVNDRGGTHCGGVTPIHDAASCGHLSIVRILLSAGASLVARTDKGDTPLHCLREWYGRVKGEIDDHTAGEFRELEREMSSTLEKIGQEASTAKNASRDARLCRSERNPFGSSPEKVQSTFVKRAQKESSRSARKHQSVLKTRPLSRVSSSSSGEEGGNISDCPSNNTSGDNEPLQLQSRIPSKSLSQRDLGSQSRYQCSRKGNGLHQERKQPASSEYARTIASLKNRHSLLLLSEDGKGSQAAGSSSSATPPGERGPLLDMDEVEVDDWLEDDLALVRPSKRVRRLGGSEQPTRGSTGSLAKPCVGVAPQTEDQQIPQEESRVAETMPQVATHTHASDQHQQNHSSNLQLVKVEVEGSLLLVPTNKDATFDCLAKEVARRYHDFKGVNVELTLHTPEGALLSKSDPISLLSSLDTSNNMTLVGNVISVSLPPIAESYANACAVHHIAPMKGVIQRLELCQAVHSLILDEMALGPRQLHPVTQVIAQRRHITIHRLSIASNNIGDRGLKLLCEGLTSMQSLVALDLSCNGITAVGLSDLASIFSKQSVLGRPLQMLGELNLSHNPIRDSGFPHLVSILNSLLSLTSLCLCGCSLSDVCSSISNPLSLDSVEQLDVSLNPLGAEGVASFLRTLSPGKLKVLNVSRTLGKATRSSLTLPRKVAREVALLLTRDVFEPPSNLLVLDLSQTCVNDSDFCELIRGIEQSSHLENLNIESNPDLTSLSLRRLFQTGRWSRLKVTLGGCPKIFDFMESDCAATNWWEMGTKTDLPSEVHLSVGEGVCGDAVDVLIMMWKKALGSDAFVERELFGLLKLGVKSRCSSLAAAS